MLQIEPIKLLRGSHADTGATGQGCFMNVVAYLNGEPQITDESPCVCVTIRPIAIWLNDFLTDDERPRMVPFIERALGSSTKDKVEMVRRAKCVAAFARDCAEAAVYAARAARAAEAAARAAAAAYAVYAARAARAAEAAARAAAAAYAAYAAAARAAVYAADAATRQKIVEAAFTFLDEALPAHPAGQQVIARADELVRLAATA